MSNDIGHLRKVLAKGFSDGSVEFWNSGSELLDEIEHSRHQLALLGSDSRRDTLLQANELYNLLLKGQPHREVYRSGSDPNRWFVTYGGGEADPAAVKELIARGLINSTYDSCPDDCYHIGDTFRVPVNK